MLRLAGQLSVARPHALSAYADFLRFDELWTGLRA
jgi:hypothetical protein